ncbi:hypothetical protein GW17_00059356 [Ensete ventricosum]|nr:hypothetical protein GW17_00059356 [Ensete ventricosum]
MALPAWAATSVHKGGCPLVRVAIVGTGWYRLAAAIGTERCRLRRGDDRGTLEGGRRVRVFLGKRMILPL